MTVDFQPREWHGGTVYGGMVALYLVTHALARMRSCSAAAAARASLWDFSELRSGLRKSETDEFAELEFGMFARG